MADSLRLTEHTDQKRARECVESLFESYPQGPFRNTIWFEVRSGYAEIAAFEGALHLSAVYVLAPLRRQGHGAAIMKVLMDAADRAGVRITLIPKPFSVDGEKMDAQQLVRWYERLGFVGDEDKMVRSACLGNDKLVTGIEQSDD